MDLLSGKIKGGLVVRAPGVDDHAVKGPSFLHDLFQRRDHGLLLGNVGGDCPKLATEAFGHLLELIAGLGQIDRVDRFGTVDEAAFCDAEADASVGASD